MLEKKIRRYKLMDAHRELVRTGKLYEAHLVLELLRNGKLKLYLGDADWNVEKLCEEGEESPLNKNSCRGAKNWLNSFKHLC